MRSGFFMRTVLVIVLLAGLVTVGAYVYNLGLAQGAAASLAEAAPEDRALPPAYYYAPYYRPWGFGLIGLCFPILAVLLILAALRGLFFRRGWRGYGPGGWGWPGRYKGSEGGIPPMVDEWHRKMHASEGEEPTATEPPSA